MPLAAAADLLACQGADVPWILLVLERPSEALEKIVRFGYLNFGDHGIPLPVPVEFPLPVFGSTVKMLTTGTYCIDLSLVFSYSSPPFSAVPSSSSIFFLLLVSFWSCFCLDLLPQPFTARKVKVAVVLPTPCSDVAQPPTSCRAAIGIPRLSSPFHSNWWGGRPRDY